MRKTAAAQDVPWALGWAWVGEGLDASAPQPMADQESPVDWERWRAMRPAEAPKSSWRQRRERFGVSRTRRVMQRSFEEKDGARGDMRQVLKVRKTRSGAGEGWGRAGEEGGQEGSREGREGGSKVGYAREMVKADARRA